MSDVKDTLEAMIAGTHENEEVEELDEQVEDEGVEEVEEVEEQEESTDTADIEDTDQEEDAEDEDETDDDSDEGDEETSEDSDDDEEEDAQEATDEKSETTEDEDAKEEDTGDTTDTPENTPDPVDYKAFYEQVAEAKFTANGREVEGFKDPKDLIRAQQMLHGYSDKMKVFKDYKKFIKPLEERAITTNPDKFNLAMSLIDGDEEAIKQVIKDKGLDPLEFDLENINYTPRNTLPSDAQMLVEDYAAKAKDLGVDDKFYKVLSQDFDEKSVDEFLKKRPVREDLLVHLKDGTYDRVQDEIRTMELLDSNGELDGYSSVEKYRMAINRINERNVSVVKQEPKKVVDNSAAEAAAKAKKTADELAEFKRKAAAKEKQVAEERKKAASVTKKRVVKQKKREVPLEEMNGSDFRKSFDQMLMG